MVGSVCICVLSDFFGMAHAQRRKHNKIKAAKSIKKYFCRLLLKCTDVGRYCLNILFGKCFFVFWHCIFSVGDDIDGFFGA